MTRLHRVFLSATGLIWGLTVCPAQSSPFMAANQAKAGASAGQNAEQGPAEFEFTGFVNLGGTPMVCITSVAEQRSHWLKPGQSAHGISLVSHDAATDQVVIRHQGRDLRLALKERSFDESKLAAYQPPASSGPVRSAGLAEHVPLTPKEKETEARMLVSDLLEIGMIQRKAYAEAKQKEVEAKRDAAKQD